MISEKVLTTLEYNKIKEKLKAFATLNRTKTLIDDMKPSVEYEDVLTLQKKDIRSA